MNQRKDLYPHPFPPAWASAWGDDQYGLWADVKLKSQPEPVLFRMRWIMPGTFLMGAPESELNSYDNEQPQHPVTISQGFWLADTACTQGLWQALMQDNPSSFNEQNGGGAEHPVERVSWLDVQVFLQKLTQLLPRCLVTLPTEAEWEYACRAGTSTAFAFGANLSPRQVNYDGNYPYADGAKGEYRERTVLVKELAANRWGLCQMHGNVWEWCADPQRQYAGEALDPGLEHALAMAKGGGADSGSRRVIRGGGWGNLAQRARSACRNHLEPAARDQDLGFRFVVRSRSQAKQGF